MSMTRSHGAADTAREKGAAARVLLLSSWLVPAVTATAVTLLLAEGDHYPLSTIAPFVVGIAGIAYSLRAIANRSESRDESDSYIALQTPEASRSIVDEIQEFKALLAVSLPRSETSEWLVSPHPVLDGATPVEVFFRHGLNATRTAIVQSQEDKRTPI